MSPYEIVYLSLFALLPLAMAFLTPLQRFLILWTAIFLVPREFNVRLGPVSFCLTDAAFLGLVLPEIIALFREGWKKSRLAHGSGFAWAALGLFAAGTVYHLTAHGITNPRFFLKDILIYGVFPVLFLALRRSGISWRPSHIHIMGLCLFLISAVILLIAFVPYFREAYKTADLQQAHIGASLGYFHPGGVKALLEDKRPFSILNLRAWGFVGGIPLGYLFIFYFPILLNRSRPLFPRTTWVPLLLGFVFFGTLFLQSRTIFFSVFLGVFSCLVLFPKGSRKFTAGVAAIFILLSAATPIGQNNWKRYGLLKSKELEGIYEKPSQEAGKVVAVEKAAEVKREKFKVYDSRFPIWATALSVIREHPLSGIGPGGVLVFPYFTTKAENTFVDSIYITLPLKWGVGALLLFLAWLVQLALRWWKAWPLFRGKTDFEVEVLRGFLPAGIAFLFLGIFSFPFMNISFSMFLASYLALSLNTLDEYGKAA